MIHDKRGGDSGGGDGDWHEGEDRQGLLAGGDYGHDDGGSSKEVAAPNGGELPQVRTPGRVRFNDVPEVVRMSTASSRRSGDSLDGVDHDDHDPRSTLDLEDPLRDDHDDHRRPLLTSIEAPSVALANDLDDAVEQELRRPKSDEPELRSSSFGLLAPFALLGSVSLAPGCGTAPRSPGTALSSTRINP